MESAATRLNPRTESWDRPNRTDQKGNAVIMLNENARQQQVHLYVGLDLGKRRDYSALAIVEYRREWNLVRNPIYWTLDPIDEEIQFSVRHLERIPLETKYVDVAFTVHQLLTRLTRQHDCTLIIDATGVGQPVVEMFQDLPLGATLAPVVITAGGNEYKGKDEWRVPKQDLIGGLQVMIESEQLGVARDLAFAQALLEELIEMRGDVYGAAAARAHDDLVIATALAAWRARRFTPELPGTPSKYGFQNNDFGRAIYGCGSSPWSWPAAPPRRSSRE
jgi:hypothetical protein